jgi:hypothetical protein
MRTGSNLFEETITQFEDIICFGELFNPHFIGAPKRPTLETVTIEERDADPISAIETMIMQNPEKLTGFRLFSDHDPMVLDHCLKDETCAKIVLTRNPMDSFVSHQIAAQTGQWKLRNLHLRKDAKIEFKIDDFQMYLEARNANRSLINGVLQTTGQTAFQISYEDMANLETFNGVAKFLGIDKTLTSFVTEAKRQNPDSLEDKLTNYKQMREQVRDLNIFESETEAYIEPSKTRTSVVIHAGRTFPVMYFPVTYDPKDPTLNWMQRLEADGNPPETNMTGMQVQQWLSGTRDRFVISCLEHPVERAFRAFNDRIVFLPPEQNKWIRAAMVSQFGLDLPTWQPNSIPTKDELGSYDYGAESHAKNFEKFLEFLKGNLRGQTRAPLSPEWGSQHLQIESFHRWTVPNFTIRPDQRDAMFKVIENMIGKEPATEPIVETEGAIIPLEQVYSDRIEKMTRVAYFNDYRKFGFQDWKPKS